MFDDSLLRSLPFYENLTDADIQMIARGCSIRRFQPGTMLLCGDGICMGMMQVKTGSVRVFLLSEEGREITLFRVQKDHICVLSASCVIAQITFETHIKAETDCEIFVINADVFQKLTERNIYVRCFMYELLTERFSTVMWTMQQILFAKFDCRLAGFLLAEYEKTGKTEIRMTQEQIAVEVNSAREVVARMLKRFASDNWIELKRGTIVLKNIAALRDMK